MIDSSYYPPAIKLIPINFSVDFRFSSFNPDGKFIGNGDDLLPFDVAGHLKGAARRPSAGPTYEHRMLIPIFVSDPYRGYILKHMFKKFI